MKIAFFDSSLFYESLGLANLMGMMKAHNYDYKLFIISEEKDLLKSVKEYNPDLLCFSVCTGTHYLPFQTARFLKQHMDVLILFGGPHATLFPEECIKEDCVDMICIGEGEDALLELVQILEKKEDYTKIKNLWIKRKGVVYRNEIRQLVEDLDTLPLPDRLQYYKNKVVRDLPLKRFITGYGCYFKCAFCHNPSFLELYKGKGKYLRKKSANRIVQEIFSLQYIAVVKRIHFHDDNFIFDKKWLKEFCEVYKREIGLPWSCTIRVDLFDEETAKMMSKAGCVGITTGLETHNEAYRNNILKKYLSNKDFERTGELCQKYNIKHIAATMLNLPGETIEDAFKTLEFVRKIKATHIRAAVYSVTAKQPIVPWLISSGFLDKEPEINNFEKTYLTDITIQSDDKDRIIRLSSAFNIMLKFPFLIPFFKFLSKFQINIGRKRLYDTYLESKFMGLSLFQALNYYITIKKGMKAFQGLR